jgi:hypothetical protein
MVECESGGKPGGGEKRIPLPADYRRGTISAITIVR